ncbi:MAG: hypothetical protein VXY73_07310 [Pseudomonadota bacterium]|nr:hypothetical protein [Pseudomonadota bacterium]
MSRIFGGVARVINRITGDTVTIQGAGGASFDVQARFREGPLELLNSEFDNGVISIVATLEVPRDLVAAHGIAAGQSVAPGNGKTYTITDPVPSGSPARDAFLVFGLEQNEEIT